MINAVIFDMDGLMFDTEPVWDVCLRQALTELGLPVYDEFIDSIRGTAHDGFDAAARDYYGVDVDTNAMWDLREKLVTEEFARQIVKKPGLDELLQYLEENNIPCAVGSSSIEAHIRMNLETAGLADKFAVVVSGQYVEHSKPAPDIFLLAADKLGVEPASALVLEDSYNGVRAGAAGGFVTVMVPDTLEPTPEMEKLATRICPSLLAVRDALAAGEL